MADATFVGLNVNGPGLQVAVRPTGEEWSAERDDHGIIETAEKLQEFKPQLVVMEALGGVELPVAGTLAAVGLPFALISPRSIREFARAIGRLRPDQNHAGLLAQFAELVRPEARPMPEQVVEQIRALKTRRKQIEDMLALERLRLHQDSPSVFKDLKQHIQFLEKSYTALGEEISRTVRASCVWR